MSNQLPAIVIGGPPHAGKSVLLYNLTQALYERGIRHHAIRACPDGEGNWFQEGFPVTVDTIRRSNKREWSSAFVSRMSSDLEHRCLPFLVDMGGHPQANELPMFQQCTHSVLLLRTDKPDATRLWQSFSTQADLQPLAQIFSQQQGTSTITAHAPLLQGTITGLERQSQTVRNDPVFLALLEQIADLFRPYSTQEIERVALQRAPIKPVLNLPEELHAYTTTSIYWQPEMLAPFLHHVPENTPLSVYGWGPNWLYAALAAHNGQQAFYLFDPKLSGWTQPVPMRISEEPSPEIIFERRAVQDATLLSISFSAARIEYFQPQPFVAPPIPTERGLILDGPLPYWLLTALIRLYQQAGVAWIATHHAQQNRDGQQKTAIIVFTRDATRHIGDLLAIPAV